MSNKSFVDSIRVDDPCSENWDEMEGTDRIRFCSHCSKNVNNISSMTRQQVARLVRKSGGHLCVRYRFDPVTRAPIFGGRVSSLALNTAAAGVLGVSLLSTGTLAQSDPAPQAFVQIDRTEKVDGGLSSISGYVTDPNGAAIPYAIASVTNQETYVAQVQNASAEGFYEFKDLTPGMYKLHFEGGGFASRDIEGIEVTESAYVRRDGQLALLKVDASVEVRGAGENQGEWMGTVGVVVLIENRNDLVAAVLREDFENVKARILMGARINVRDKSNDGMSPLHAAVERGNLEIAEYLLVHGAKANIRDSFKRTPLMMMADDATNEMFQLLVRFGAKPTLLDKQKNTILHHFAENLDDADIVRKAATFGINVNAVNKEGKTALMIAVENDASDVVRALLDSGADVNIRDRSGRTALDLAGDKLDQTRSILETYGAVRGITR